MQRRSFCPACKLCRWRASRRVPVLDNSGRADFGIGDGILRSMLARSAVRDDRARGREGVALHRAERQIFGRATMKPLHATDIAHAAAIDGHNHGRTRAVELLISERNALIRDAARFYPGCRDREVARQLLISLARYRNGRWRRDGIREVCPPQHKGKLLQVLWLILKTIDAIPSDRTVRAALAQSRFEFANWGTRCPASDR